MPVNPAVTTPPASSTTGSETGSLSTGKAVAVAIGVVAFGTLILVGAALLVISNQRSSRSRPRSGKRRRRVVRDEDDY
jgi:hypothetical protein